MSSGRAARFANDVTWPRRRRRVSLRFGASSLWVERAGYRENLNLVFPRILAPFPFESLLNFAFRIKTSRSQMKRTVSTTFSSSCNRFRHFVHFNIQRKRLTAENLQR